MNLIEKRPSTIQNKKRIKPLKEKETDLVEEKKINPPGSKDTFRTNQNQSRASKFLGCIKEEQFVQKNKF